MVAGSCLVCSRRALAREEAGRNVRVRVRRQKLLLNHGTAHSRRVHARRRSRADQTSVKGPCLFEPEVRSGRVVVNRIVALLCTTVSTWPSRVWDDESDGSMLLRLGIAQDDVGGQD